MGADCGKLFPALSKRIKTDHRSNPHRTPAGSAGIIYVTRVITESRTGMGTGLWQTVIQLGLCLGPSIGTLVLRESPCVLPDRINPGEQGRSHYFAPRIDLL